MIFITKMIGPWIRRVKIINATPSTILQQSFHIVIKLNKTFSVFNWKFSVELCTDFVTNITLSIYASKWACTKKKLTTALQRFTFVSQMQCNVRFSFGIEQTNMHIMYLPDALPHGETFSCAVIQQMKFTNYFFML